MHYLITAYRWGHTNAHQYTVAIVSDQKAACALAESACDERGGKYGVMVEAWDEDGPSTRVAYFPSMCHETEPSHNERVDMFERIGQEVHRAVEDLAVWDAPASGRGPNVRRDIKAPDWLVAIVLEEEISCRFKERIHERTINPFQETSAPQPTLSPGSTWAESARAEAEAEARTFLQKALTAA